MKFWVKFIFFVFVFLFFSTLLKSQGANTCAGAISNPISLPASFNSINTCTNTNTYIGNGACQFNFYYNANDRFFAFTATTNGFVDVQMTDISGAGAVMPSISAFLGCPGSNACLSFNTVSITTGNTADLSIIFPVSLGQTYVVLVDGYSNGGNLLECFNFDMTFNYINIPTQPSCTNMGFESGDFSGWFASTGASRQSTSGNTTPSYDISALGEVSGRHTLFSSGVDPYGNFPRVAPSGGSFSIRLGNQFSSAEAEQLVQKFVVSTSNSSFTYKYAVVFQDPNHNSNEQPFFKAMLKDQNGQIIQCSEFIVSAAGNLPGFLVSPVSPNVLYKPWSTVNVDLVDYIGQEVSVEFTTGDCSQGGHFGYAYIDGDCSPSFLTSQNDTICPGQSTMLQAPAGYASYSWMPGNLTTQNVTVSPTVTTNYTLSATSFNGCVRNFTIPVVVKPNPVVSIVASNANCNGTVTLTSNATIVQGSISQLEWTVLGLPAGNQNSITPQLPGPGSFPVSLQATSSFGCQSMVSQAVVIPNCQLTVNVTGDTICPGECFTLSASSTNANGSVSYSWSNGGPANAATWQVCPTNTTSYTVTATTSTGQTATAQVTVFVSALPVINFTSTPIACLGAQNGVITATPSIAGTYQYVWSNGATSQTIQNLTAGTYSVTVSDGSCSQPASFTLNPGPVITFSASPISATCGNNNGGILIQSTNISNAPYSINVDGTTSISNILPFTINNLSAANHTVIFTNNNGCTATQNIAVNTASTPQSFNVQTTAATCGQNNGCIQLTNVIGGTAPFTYALNGGTFQTNAQFCSLASGTYSITVNDANNCSFTQSATVNSTANLSVNIVVNQTPNCPLETNGSLSAQISGGSAPHTITWSNGATTNTIQNLAPGIYQVTVTDANNCTATNNVMIAQPVDFLVNIQPVSETCSAQNGAISLNISGVNSPFEVNFNNTIWNNQTQFLNLGAGNYPIQVRDANGCIKTFNQTVSGTVAITNYSSTSQAAICGQNNGCIQLSNIIGGTAPFTYALNGGTFQTNAQFCSLASGTYNITVNDANNCSFTQSATVNSTANLSVNIVVNQTPICPTETNGSLTAQISGGLAPHTIVWSNGATTNTIQNLSPSNYQVTVTDANNCTATNNVMIAHPADFAISYMETPTLCGLNNGQLQIQVTGNTAPYEFSLDNTNWQINEQFDSLSSSNHSIWVRDANGCIKNTVAQVSSTSFINDFSINSISSTCGNANAELQLGNFIGVNQNLTYSLDGSSWMNANANGFTINNLSAGNYSVWLKDGNDCEVVKTTTILDISGPTSTVSSQQATTCGQNNGCLTVSQIIGGTAPYSLELNTNVIQLNAPVCQLANQTYSLQITDANGCELIENVNIGSLSGLVALATVNQQVSCNGAQDGSASVFINGGLAPYQVQWNDGSTLLNRNNLAAGNYTITVVDATQCTVQTNIIITEPQVLSANIIQFATFCGLNNGNIEINTISGGTLPFSFFLNGVPNNIAQWSQLPSGNYQAQVFDARGCLWESNLTIDATPYVQQFTTINSPSTCGLANGAISIITVQGSNTGLSYSINQSQFENVTSFPLVINGLMAGNYNITIKDQNNCAVQQTISIASLDSPNQINIQTQSATCNASNACIEIVQVLGGTSPYLFSFNGNQFSTTQQFCSLAAGDYGVVVKDANGCQLNQIVQVQSLQPPVASTQLMANVSCFGLNNGQAQALISGGQAPFLFAWSNGETNALANALDAGNHTVTITDANQCVSQASITIAEPEMLTAEVTSQATTCGLQNGEIVFQNVGGGVAPYQYSTLAFPNAINQTPHIYNLNNGTYQAVVTDQNGCIWQQTIEVGVTSYPVSINSISIDATCGLNNGQWILSDLVGGVAPFSFQFQNNGWFDFNTNQLAFSSLSAGQYSLEVKDQNGCILNSTVQIQQFMGPEALQFSLTHATCDLDNAAIELNNVVGGTAPFVFGLNNNILGNTQNFSSLSGGEYVYHIKDANGCELDTQLTLNVIVPVAIHSVVVQRVRCFGEQNGAAKVEILSGVPPYQIQWLNGGNSPIQWNLGEGVVSVMVTDANQCVDSSQIYISQPTPIQVNITGVNEFCLGGSTLLSASSSGGGVHHTLNWLHNNSSNPYQTLQPNVTTTYLVTATDMMGCVGKDSMTILVHQPPAIDIIANLKVGCAPVCIEFSPIADLNQLVAFNWTFENGLTSNITHPKNCYDETGPVFASLAVQDIYGCSSQVSYDTIAFVYPNPVANFTPTENIVDVQAAQVTMINQSTPVPLYYWSFDDGNTSFEANPTHTFPDTGSYNVCLIAQSEFGCQGKVCHPIDVIAVPTYYIPSAFSPNDDGLNDVFNVQGTYLKSIKMWIYNRWGEQLFFTDRLDSGWNGSYQGSTLSPDVFVWKIQLTSSFNEVIDLSGKVVIVN